MFFATTEDEILSVMKEYGIQQGLWIFCTKNTCFPELTFFLR
jgi:hypothetical protein